MLPYARLLTSTIFMYSSLSRSGIGLHAGRSGPGLNVCWLIKDRLRCSYKAQLPPPTSKHFRKWLCVGTDLRSRAYVSKLVRDVKHDLLRYVMTATASTDYFFFDNF